MSHCRHLFSQGYSTQLVHRPLVIALGSFFNVTTAIPARFVSTRPNGLVPRTLLRRGATSNNASLYPTKSTSTLVGTDTIPKTDSITGDMYQLLRKRDRHLVSNLPTSTYLNLVDEALVKSPDLANCVVRDIVEVYRGKHSSRTHMLQAILSQDFFALDRSVVVSVLERLKDTPEGLDFLSSQSVVRLVRMIVPKHSSTQIDRLLIQFICPVISARAMRFRAPGGALSATYRPPTVIYAAFEFVHKLLSLSHQQEALSLFQILIDSRHIPLETIQGLDSSSNDVNIIICIALARASLHWNWRSLTIIVVNSLLDLPGPSHQSVIDLNLDTIYAILDTPTRRDMVGCRHLICKVHCLAPVPNSVVRQFYTSAAQSSAGNEAELLYQFTRTTSILEQHHYPPPDGLALSWLMYHLTVNSRRTHLSRQLASEVVQDNLPLPLQFRARFLSNTAAQGYASLARKLWERYSVGNDKHVVVGNSALMIRMISLFAHLRRQARASLESLQDPSLHLVADETLQRKCEDLTTFLTQVLQSYRTHHAPLLKAPHQALTSLARACFIVGKYAEGLEVFKVLLQRKEIPDMYDVNVALTAVAEAKPHLAAKMIGRMIEKGLKPDAVTFGTVMHSALLCGDQALVNEMMDEIRRLRDTRLTLQSVAGLIRATIILGTEDQKDLRSRLRSVLTMIKSLSETTPLSPQTGKYLVSVSLRAQDFVMAYEFWNLLLRESAEWNDREQQLLRRRIADMIKQHRAWLDSDRMFYMLSQLDQ